MGALDPARGTEMTAAARTTLNQTFVAIERIEDRGVTFLDAKGREKLLPYAQLIESARRFAGGLRARGVEPGEPVVIVLPEPEEALIAIIGSMLAGSPPAPIYPPMGFLAVPAFLRYLRHVAARARAVRVVTSGQITPVLGAVPRDVDTIRGIDKFSQVIGAAPLAQVADVSADSTAFLQFTSGSTAAPKGVRVTHGNVCANLAMIREASGMDRSSCVVSWLPVYHDMGLIGTCLNAITLGIPLVVMSPRAFLRKPILWLEAIARHRGTHTAAPNFAYGLCVKRISKDKVRTLDLSTMKTFICGAEPVLPQTMERFVAHFSPAGLNPGALAPAYGLAEATLAVTFTPQARGLYCDSVDAEELAHNHAARCDSDSQRLRVPSCGSALTGVEVRIGDEKGNPLSEREVGEIQIRGASITPGYVNDPEATRASRTPDGWLRTGDLGYLVDGELFPCGRQKDLIIIRGRNLHAHDLEAVASELAGVRTGNVVAFATPAAQDSEELVVIAECKADADKDALALQIRAHLAESCQVTPRDVRVVPPGTLPKTSSGKLRRTETRRLYLEGTLQKNREGYLAAWGVALRSSLARISLKAS